MDTNMRIVGEYENNLQTTFWKKLLNVTKTCWPAEEAIFLDLIKSELVLILYAWRNTVTMLEVAMGVK